MQMSFRLHFVVALLVLTCAQFTFAQDAPSKASFKYSKPINFPSASNTYAYAINDNGEVVGFYTGDGCSQASCGFTDVKNKFTSIECALENATDIFDISNKGEIVGAYSHVGGVNGFIWEGNGSCFDLVDPLASNLTEAWGVNDSGKVVGFYINSSGNFQGFEYVNGKYTTILCSGWTDTRAFGINDAGLIVGDVANSISGPFSGFVYKSGKCTTFNFPKVTSTSARGVNKHGQISGWYADVKGVHGFVKTKNSFKKINYPKAAETFAYHINDAGQVAGWYQLVVNGPASGFVATPQK